MSTAEFLDELNKHDAEIKVSLDGLGRSVVSLWVDGVQASDWKHVA